MAGGRAAGRSGESPKVSLAKGLGGRVGVKSRVRGKEEGSTMNLNLNQLSH